MSSMNTIGGHTKKYYRSKFDDTRDALFNSAWKNMLSFRGATELDTEEEVTMWLENIIGEKVNDENSRFYIHG